MLCLKTKKEEKQPHLPPLKNTERKMYCKQNGSVYALLEIRQLAKKIKFVFMAGDKSPEKKMYCKQNVSVYALLEIRQ